MVPTDPAEADEPDRGAVVELVERLDVRDGGGGGDVGHAMGLQSCRRDAMNRRWLTVRKTIVLRILVAPRPSFGGRVPRNQ